MFRVKCTVPNIFIDTYTSSLRIKIAIKINQLNGKDDIEPAKMFDLFLIDKWQSETYRYFSEIYRLCH